MNVFILLASVSASRSFTPPVPVKLCRGANSPADGSGKTIRIRYRIPNARLAAGVSARQGGGVDQAYDGWRVASQFLNFSKGWKAVIRLGRLNDANVVKVMCAPGMTLEIGDNYVPAHQIKS